LTSQSCKAVGGKDRSADRQNSKKEKKNVTTETKSKTTAGPNRRPQRKKLAPEERHLKVQETAYYRAERDGFKQDAADYWLAAEAEVGPFCLEEDPCRPLRVKAEG